MALTHLFALPIFFLALSFSAHDAAGQHALHGRVVDESGAPLSGASVTVHSDGTTLVAGVASAEDGRFRLFVDEGRYRLKVSHIGFATYEHWLELPRDVGALLEIVLTVSVIEERDVVVESRRVRPRVSPVTYSNLTSRELETLPSMKDLPVLLSTLPSITFHSENGNGIGYSTMRMRGFDQRRIAVSINGIPQNDPEDFNVFWINFFDIQGAVQDIQVQRGANAAFYGPEGISGAVNIVARPYTEDAYVMAEGGYGSFDTRRFTIEASTGRIGGYSAYGRLSRLLTDGYRDNSWAEFIRFFGGIERQTANSRVAIQAYGGPQRDGLSFSGIPLEANAVERGEQAPVDRRFNASAFTGDTESFHQPHAELLHEWRPSDRVSLSQAFFGVLGIGYFDFGATFRSADYLQLPQDFGGLSAEERSLPLFLTAPDTEVLFRAYLDQWQVGWLPRLTVEHELGTSSVGLEARLHRSLRWGRMQEAEGIPSNLVGSDNDVRVYSFRGEKTIASIFASHLMRPYDRLAIQADIQLTHRNYRIFDEAFFGNELSTGFLFLNPRIGATWNPDRPLSYYASVALANREPRMKDIYDGEEAGAGFLPQFEVTPDGSLDYSSPLVRPERLYNVEVGGRLVGQHARVTANVFLMLFDDEIVPSGGLDQFGVPRTGNAERTRHLGLEIDGEVHVVAGLHAHGNATISRNRFVRFTEFDFAQGALSRDGNPIAGFPEQTAYLGARWTRGTLSVNAGSRLAGRQYIDNAAERETAVAPYALIDASILFSPRGPLSGLEFRLDVNNVLDSRVLMYGNVGPVGPQYFPAATRHVYAGFRYTVR